MDKALAYVAVDVMVKTSSTDRLVNLAALPEDLFDFADALLELTPELAQVAFPPLLQTELFERVGPTLHLVPVPHDAHAVFDLSKWSRIVGTTGHPRLAGTAHVPSAADLRDPDERHAHVRQWMTEMALDAGFIDMEDQLAKLGPLENV